MSLTSEVQRSLARLDSSAPALRSFSRVVGGALLLASAALLWRRSSLGAWFLGGGALLLAAGLVAPRVLRPLHRVWMGLAFAVGYCASRLVLVLVFCLVLTPLSLLRRLFTRHALGETPASGSAWIRRDKSAPRDYRKMY